MIDESIDANQHVAYHNLRNGIIHAVYKPGVRLSIKGLSEVLDMSRTPIREALIRLQHEGLVDSIPHSGTYVSYINLHAAKNALYVRKNLETAAAVECCDCATIKDIYNIDRILDGLEASVLERNACDFFVGNALFSQELFKIVNKEEVWKWIDSLSVSLDRMSWLIASTEKLDWEAVFKQHCAVRDAISEGAKRTVCELESDYLSSMLEHEDVVLNRFGEYFSENQPIPHRLER